LKYQSVPVFTICSAEEFKTSFLYRLFIYNWQHKDRSWGVYVFLSDFVLAFVTQCSSLSLLFRCPYLCLQGECVHACVKHTFKFRGVGEHTFVTQTYASRVSVIVHTVRYVIEPLPPR
jgi:hypothetical protein